MGEGDRAADVGAGANETRSALPFLSAWIITI